MYLCLLGHWGLNDNDDISIIKSAWKGKEGDLPTN